MTILARPKTLLRQPEERDIIFLLGLRNDVDLQLLLAARPRPNTVERVRAWMSRLLDDPNSVFFVIADHLGEACGYVQLSQIDFVSRFGQMGICLSSEARGKGHAADALAILEDYVQAVFDLRKIVLTVLSSNTRAIAFYRKYGFLDVGIHRQHFYSEGTYHDMLVMEKLIGSASSHR
jgi:RimJ/RimL family protein N-acetyltransferase